MDRGLWGVLFAVCCVYCLTLASLACPLPFALCLSLSLSTGEEIFSLIFFFRALDLLLSYGELPRLAETPSSVWVEGREGWMDGMG